MKIKATIEETISQTFEVEVTDIENAYEELREMYRDGKLVVDNATLIEANVLLDGDDGDWVSLHV